MYNFLGMKFIFLNDLLQRGISLGSMSIVIDLDILEASNTNGR